MPERYVVSNNKGEIYYEHIKRYLFAKDFIVNKDTLDVACGSGYGSHFLANSGARYVHGIDISKKTIGYCRKRYRAPNLSFEIMDASALKFPAASFDAIVSFETIEHIEDYDSFLLQLKRVLRPGGKIIISTPNKAVYGMLKGDAHKFHIREFELEEFQELISRRFNIDQLYGERRSENCEKRIACCDYNKELLEAAKKNTILKAIPLRFKNIFPENIRRYLAAKITKFSFPGASSLEDLVISQDHIAESKFFICVATNR
ncbi:MAG: class I SAM-dependent methyltransferase [Candidatus Omnitrophota bacterium]|jgi:ubiquinone/menaquinone biosynthesis C-methylase UbiE